MMYYLDLFKKIYRSRLSHMTIQELSKCEKNVSALIDSDLFDNCMLQDEIFTLYELVRDECSVRINRIAEHALGNNVAD